MSIAAIDFNPAASATQSARDAGRSPFQAVEDLLGMKPTEIRAALDSGKSLVDLAAEKGISKDDLIKAIATAITTDRPGISADRATQIATRIATQVPKAGAAAGVGGTPPPTAGTDADGDKGGTTSATAAKGKHHHRHHAKADSVLNAVSGALGMQTTDLVTALKSGQTLGQLASAKGVSEDDLLASIASALQSSSSTGTDGSYGSSASGGTSTGTLVNAAA